MVLRVSLALLLAGFAGRALAQSNSNDNSSVADRSPAENVKAGNVAARSPGNSVIRPALERHQQLQNERLHGADSSNDNSDDNSDLEPTPSDTDDALGDLLSSLTGGSSSLDALSGLLGNEGVTSLLGGGLSSLFGGGTSTSTGTGATTTGATTGSTTGATDSSGATPTAEQQSSLDLLLQLRDQYGSTSKSRQSSDANAGRRVLGTTAEKSAARSQTNGGDDEEDSFRVRLYDAWLGTIFTALTLAVTSRDFIDAIKDVLRPIFGIAAPPPPTTQPTTQPSQVRHLAPATERMLIAPVA